MIYGGELLLQILRDMRQHKLRSLLAMFGVAWGTITVVLLLALGEAYHAANKTRMLDIADNSLLLLPGTTSKPYRGRPIGQSINIKAADIENLPVALPEIQHISPVLYSPTENILNYSHQQMVVAIQGVSVDYGKITKQQPQTGGRFFNPIDIQWQRAVIFLDDTVQKKLFGNASALHQTVSLNGVPLNVVGVAQAEKTGAINYGYSAYIPYTTAIQLWGDQNIRQAMIRSHHPRQIQSLQYKLTYYLSAKYHFDPTDQQAVMIVDLTQYTQFFTWFFAAIKIFLALCGAITLGIGGIGVSNMMYLIVTERTAEIGLRMALGAKPQHILWQFLLESTVIVLLGSLAGLGISLIGLQILQHLSLPEWLGTPTFSKSVFLITLIILTIIAGITGYFPARRAAALLPVEALAF